LTPCKGKRGTTKGSPGGTSHTSRLEVYNCNGGQLTEKSITRITRPGRGIEQRPKWEPSGPRTGARGPTQGHYITGLKETHTKGMKRDILGVGVDGGAGANSYACRLRKGGGEKSRRARRIRESHPSRSNGPKEKSASVAKKNHMSSKEREGKNREKTVANKKKAECHHAWVGAAGKRSEDNEKATGQVWEILIINNSRHEHVEKHAGERQGTKNSYSSVWGKRQHRKQTLRKRSKGAGKQKTTLF